MAMSPEADVTGEANLPGALLTPASYPHRPSSVSLIETHISWIFLAGNLVYKVKKPVRTPFLDFSTLVARQHFLTEELRLNATLAPGVCRAVVPIVRDGAHLHIRGHGVPVEYALEMRRLPSERMLEHLLEQGVVDNAMMTQLAHRLAWFHAHADRAPTELGAPEEVLAAVTRNLQELAASKASFAASAVVLLERYAVAYVRKHREAFVRRAAEGRIRDGHGDLHAGNICFEGDSLIIYDRIEFEPRFRQMDVAADLAFLAMDLDHRGFMAFSDFLVRQYGQDTGDTSLPDVMPFYKMHRAAIRAKVADLRFEQQHVPEDRASVRAYCDLALSYALANVPFVVIMCGLPGSGKTWVARELAARTRAHLLRSDVVRRSLSDQPAYDEHSTMQIYEAMFTQARSHLARGAGVVLDATFDRRALRDAVRDLAARARAPSVTVLVDCSEPIVRNRLQQREREGADASQANWLVYQLKKAGFEEPGSGEPRVIAHKSGLPTEPLVCRVLEALIEVLR